VRQYPQCTNSPRTFTHMLTSTSDRSSNIHHLHNLKRREILHSIKGMLSHVFYLRSRTPLSFLFLRIYKISSLSLPLNHSSSKRSELLKHHSKFIMYFRVTAPPSKYENLASRISQLQTPLHARNKNGILSNASPCARSEI
jgi:hypothetical protein